MLWLQIAQQHWKGSERQKPKYSVSPSFSSLKSDAGNHQLNRLVDSKDVRSWNLKRHGYVVYGLSIGCCQDEAFWTHSLLSTFPKCRLYAAQRRETARLTFLTVNRLIRTAFLGQEKEWRMLRKCSLSRESLCNLQEPLEDFTQTARLV